MHCENPNSTCWFGPRPNRLAATVAVRTPASDHYRRTGTVTHHLHRSVGRLKAEVLHCMLAAFQYCSIWPSKIAHLAL